MFMKYFYKMSAAALISTVGLSANALVSNDPVDLAKKQEVLSQKIISAYAQHRNVSQVIHRLEEQQNRLKNSIHDPEINNLLDFLQICLNDIKTISAKPHTRVSDELITDLGASIGEGSRYIAHKLR